MEAIIVYKDNRGEVHPTPEAAALADARIRYQIAIERCTIGEQFRSDHFLQRLERDSALADAIRLVHESARTAPHH